MEELNGKTIKACRPMTKEEIEREGWDMCPHGSIPMCIELDDGTLIYPSRDEEGNGPGIFFGFAAGKTVAWSCHAS